MSSETIVLAVQTQARFDGLAFPVIRVRLSNNKGTATMKDHNNNLRRATLSYDYAERDGEPFAVRTALRLLASLSGQPIDSTTSVLVPGNVEGDGYLFTVVPSYFFAAPINNNEGI